MEKIKYFIEEKILSEKGKDILIILIVILVGLGSFMLGRLSIQGQNGQFKVENSSNQANALNGLESAQNSKNELNIAQKSTSNTDINNSNKSGNFFASSKGKKYYPVGCSAGKTIKESNKIYFSTGEEAQSAGYELSSSCH
ncbi:MAG: hypothetical protein NT068_01165 [Candidatus Nomurabacteria bacterium]|nr:hypothetical protein [Candidatus Nomurabacteria bacterium]